MNDPAGSQAAPRRCVHSGRCAACVGAIALAISICAGSAVAVPRFELALQAPEEVRGPAGEAARYDVAVHLTSSGLSGDEGVQAWSVSIRVDGGRAIDAGTEGTVAADAGADPPGLLDGGFSWTELAADPDDAGVAGVTSAVVLSLERNVTLPPDGRETILRFTVEAVVPDPVEPPGGGEPACDPLQVRVGFAGGLQGSGQPVRNEVTFREQAFRPATAGAVTLVCPARARPERFRRGDANCTGGVDLSDAVFIFNFLFLGGRSPCCPDAADANDEGGVSISSGVFILNFLFLGGPEIPLPAPACGLDRTPDENDPCDYPADLCM